MRTLDFPRSSGSGNREFCRPVSSSGCREARTSFVGTTSGSSSFVTIEENYDSKNHRIYATTVEEARTKRKYYIERGQAQKCVTIWAAISEKSKVELKLLPSEKLTDAKYRDLILKKVLEPRIDELMPDAHWTFQQDGAPPHKSEITHMWLRENVPNFLNRHEWPPYSCDLNPCDYYL